MEELLAAKPSKMTFEIPEVIHSNLLHIHRVLRKDRYYIIEGTKFFMMLYNSLFFFRLATSHLMLAFCPESLITRTTFPIPLRRRQETSRDLCDTLVVGRFFGMLGRWHGGSTASATFLGGSCASTLELHWLLVLEICLAGRWKRVGWSVVA